jgi:uncharacterized protein (DUF983 family)
MTTKAASPHPSLGVMLLRGVTRRCPNCGNRRAFFDGWYRRRERCHGCNLRWARNLEGFMLGAMAINFILTGGALLITMAVGVVLTYPEVALVPVLGSTVGVTLGVGLLGYPITYTTWLAIDLYMRPIEEDDGTEHARTVVS